MKKIFTPLFALIAIASSAQITITKADMPVANDTFRISTATIIGIPDPTITGANYTWDYSTLMPTIQNKDTFFTVSATPFAYQFYFNNSFLYPNYKANVAHKGDNVNFFGQVTLTSVFNYYKSLTTQYTHLGFGANINGIPTSVKYDSVDVLYHFPLNYLNTDSGVFKYLVNIPTIGSYGQRTKRVNNVEGWGTVITPFGTFQCLKVRSTLYVTDTIYYTNFSQGFKFSHTDYEYKWLVNGKKIPVLQINKAGSAITSVTYLDSLRSGVPQVGIIENSVNEISFIAYPNPVSDQLNINYSLEKPASVKIELLNVVGQSISTFVDQKQTEGNYSYRFDTNAINGKGFYFLKTTVDGKCKLQKVVLQ